MEGAPNSLPVKLAVALLADRQGVIDLDLPISGSLNDPQFRVGPVIFKIIVNLIGKALTSPFSVFVHGDLNVNNIIYDPEGDNLHFIDLHRSIQTDYVQDVSVFLASVFRLPVFEKKIRARLNFAIMDFFEFSKNFAAIHRDETFEARLALGLARAGCRRLPCGCLRLL